MPVLGRQLNGSAEDGILRNVNLDSAILAGDLRRAVLFSSINSVFELLSSIDTRAISSAIFGLLIKVNEATHKGDVQLTGPTSYPGAIAGQTIYLETDGTNRAGPPETGLWVRLGYCTRNNSLNVSIDIEQPSGVLDQVLPSVSELSLFDPEEYKRTFSIVKNLVNSDEDGLYQSTETAPGVWTWVKVLAVSQPNMFTHQFLTRRH